MKRCIRIRSIIPALLFCPFVAVSQQLPHIKALSNSAAVRIQDRSTTTRWGISPEVKPDIYTVACVPGKPSKITFITDLDSITFNVSIGQSYRFNIVLNGKDTALTQIDGRFIPEAAVFSRKYIRKNKDRVSVEVPEVKELLQVIFAITPTGLKDVRSFIINHDSTDYYMEVINHFLKFRNESIVTKMDSLLKAGHYINLRMDACCFVFDMDRIVFGKTYKRFNNSGSNTNFIESCLDELTDFAKKSAFRKFYSSHSGYYDSLLKAYRRIVPIRQIWEWCEQQFPGRYHSYRIYFSPLVKGNHSTSHAENNGFRETTMFIRPAFTIPGVNDKITEALNSRVVFTEIDHNYVNPLTDQYLDQVNKVFSQRASWANGKESNGYPDPYNLFNEYMTWALYLLYCREMYNREDFKYIFDNTVNYLIKVRGFPKFMEFTEKLLDLYQKRSTGKVVADLYPVLFDWCEAQ